MVIENITEPSKISETDLNYRQLNRFAVSKSGYIQLDNLQTSGDFINSDFIDMRNFELK